ncbi:hypothetical protein [Polyangium jinanense]|uniref:Lipoprotein n=1 Tax=Polyangium jinanense TaxID=2829994 RepID=A0A9X3X7G8_9BACT|nr:hypothetical protein [Polyangium jinanense]MDC3960542.1 hypothetical protein [Polyangium jinanense]MDC3985404.1 hypothetical protein [Polyangium jinanense]
MLKKTPTFLSLGVWMLAFAGLVGCGGDEGNGGSGNNGPDDVDVPAGSTAFVAVINPVANTGHTTGTPAVTGDERDLIPVDAFPGSADTSESGIAVVGTGVGEVDVRIGDALLKHTVLAEGDVYDAPLGFDGANAETYPNTPIRYPVGANSGGFFFGPADILADVEAKLGVDDAVVVLRGGTYTGNLTITGKGVLLFGENFLENAVVINGSVTVNGEAVRLRGLTITGDLASKGNNFGISFSRVFGNTSITGNAGAFVRNVFCGTTVVPSSNATLLDNFGVEPIVTPPMGTCD